MEGVSTSNGGRMPQDGTDGSGLDADPGAGTERIAAILSDAAAHPAPAVSMTAASGGAVEVDVTTAVVIERHVSVLDQSNAALMGDAPACDACGSITVRNGTCYRCLNCGNSMGCS
jgi:ribonucleoside-diphosphate reductase alpha chain